MGVGIGACGFSHGLRRHKVRFVQLWLNARVSRRSLVPPLPTKAVAFAGSPLGPPACFYPGCAGAGLSNPIHPIKKDTQRVSCDAVLHLCQHPCGVQSKAQGFSHGLKTCHWHVFLTAFRIPLSHKENPPQSGGFLYGVDNGIRTHDLQSHNLTR